jgi:putative transposase
MKISKFIVDETQIKVGKDYFWLWVAIKPKDKDIFHIHISAAERNICLLQNIHFLRSLVKKYGRYPVSTDGGGRWYPQACKFLQIKHHLYSSYEKSIIERTIQYIKDRTESFDDDYFPCIKEKCKLKHIMNWFNMFVNMHNKEIEKRL